MVRKNNAWHLLVLDEVVVAEVADAVVELVVKAQQTTCYNFLPKASIS
jgi:hypothetical protein